MDMISKYRLNSVKILIVCVISILSFSSCSIPGFSDSSDGDSTSINSTDEISSLSSSELETYLDISESQMDSSDQDSSKGEYRIGNAVYKGETKDGYADGNGVYTSDKYSLEGIFNKNKLIDGVLSVKSGSSTIQFDVKESRVSHKNVKISFENGDRYNGDWDKNITGKGVITYANGDIYEGAFVDGVRCGEGVYTWKNSAKYNGLWNKDKMNGKGVYYYSDRNRSLSGTFVDNVPEGTMIYKYNNHEYKAIWSKGKCNSIKY